MTDTMTVLVARTDETIHYMHSVPNTLEALQMLVDGFIETAPARLLRGCPTDIICIVNEEGEIIGLPMNPLVPEYAGDVVFVRTNGEEFAGLSTEDMADITRALAIRYAITHQTDGDCCKKCNSCRGIRTTHQADAMPRTFITDWQQLPGRHPGGSK